MMQMQINKHAMTWMQVDANSVSIRVWLALLASTITCIHTDVDETA